MSIGVSSARGKKYRVSCRSTGGTVLESRFTVRTTQNVLQAVGQLQGMGSDHYTHSTGILSNGVNGEQYSCSADNGIPDPRSSTTITLEGPMIILIVM